MNLHDKDQSPVLTGFPYSSASATEEVTGWPSPALFKSERASRATVFSYQSRNFFEETVLRIHHWFWCLLRAVCAVNILNILTDGFNALTITLLDDRYWLRTALGGRRKHSPDLFTSPGTHCKYKNICCEDQATALNTTTTSKPRDRNGNFRNRFSKILFYLSCGYLVFWSVCRLLNEWTPIGCKSVWVGSTDGLLDTAGTDYSSKLQPRSSRKCVLLIYVMQI